MTCRYRSVVQMGKYSDQESSLTPLEGPGNVYSSPIAVGAGSGGVSMPSSSRHVQVQCTVPYRIKFGTRGGEDPGAPLAGEFEYPADVAPRIICCESGARFHIIGV